MKTLTILLLVFIISAFASAERRSRAEEDEIYNNFRKKFPRKSNSRGSRSEDERKKIVLEKFYEIEEHNKKDKPFKLELNEFSDLTFEEFKEGYLGYKQEETNKSNVIELKKIKRTRRAVLPEYFNWAEDPRRVVQPVQNQGGCGSCYAFAAIAALEGQQCLVHGICNKLSEQEAMECTNGCGGGSDGPIYQYTKDKGGATNGNNYPYREKNINQCSTASQRSREIGTAAQAYYKIPNDDFTIRWYLVKKGPLNASFLVYPNFQIFGNGIYTEKSGDNPGGHAVLLVGYGTENGIPYWILKNSWGTGFGYNGYFRMKRGINLCGIDASGDGMSFPWTQYVQWIP